MTDADLNSLLPFFVLVIGAAVLLLAIAWRRHHRTAAVLAVLTLLIAIATLPLTAAAGPRQVTMLLSIDNFALFYMGLVFAAAIAVAWLAYRYLEQFAGYREEFYVLLLLASAGSAVLVASTHFASFFLGLEILSVALYALIAYRRNNQLSIEAGIKYLILAAVSSSFLLFGMALVYSILGTMEFGAMAQAHTQGSLAQSAVLLTGFTMMVVGIGFKLAVVPFHIWTPDVYQGAPAPVTAFVATVSKGSMMALLLRLFLRVDVSAFTALLVVFSVVAVLSMILGNLLALRQQNVKRLLAYSSIGHLGYMLMAFLAAGEQAVVAVTFYLVAYFVTTIGAFGVVTVMSTPEHEAETLDEYRGLIWRRPLVGWIFTAMLLSLIGMPLTAGFVGKFYLLAAGLSADLWLLAIALVIGSGIGLYYYLRVIVAMFQQPDGEARPLAPAWLPGSVLLVVLGLALLWLGLWPTPIIEMIQASAAGIF